MDDAEHLLGNVIIDTLPKEIWSVMRVTAGLNFPIPDRHSLIAQLEALLNGSGNSMTKEEKSAVPFLREALKPLDFPIMTQMSGLEKIFARVSEWLWEDFDPDLLQYIDGPVDRGMMVDPQYEFREKFGLYCWEQAYEAYLDALDQLGRNPVYRHFPHVVETTAWNTGMNAGDDCNRRYFRRPLPPPGLATFPRRPRPRLR